MAKKTTEKKTVSEPKLLRRRRYLLHRSFKPGGFGFHELVDRTCLFAETFSEQLAGHPAAKHPALKALVTKIESNLFELYRVAATLPNEIEP
jgi:hypothetical protein